MPHGERCYTLRRGVERPRQLRCDARKDQPNRSPRDFAMGTFTGAAQPRTTITYGGVLSLIDEMVDTL